LDEIHILLGDPDDLSVFSRLPVNSASYSGEDFRFGDALNKFAQEQKPGILLYFGAGSAPLLTPSTLENSLAHVIRSTLPTALVNNLYSTDWAIFNASDRLDDIVHRLPSDNQLGWVMKNEAGFQVKDLPFSAESRMDIDTPTDLMMLSHHSLLGAKMKEFLNENPVEGGDRLAAIRNLLQEPAKTITVIGRSSSRVWRALEDQTQIWIRLFVEERGMIASGRRARGEVRSLFAEIVDDWGIEAVIDFLSRISDGVLWDTRVWMAHGKTWPSVADRFASDLGWYEEIEDPILGECTESILQAPIPIATGGHGTVSAGVMVLLESLRSD
jgi:hypothetical protein